MVCAINNYRVISYSWFTDRGDGTFKLLGGDSWGELRYFHNSTSKPVCMPTDSAGQKDFLENVAAHVCDELGFRLVRLL